MASEFDQSDFIDSDYQASLHPSGSHPGASGGAVPFVRPPSLEELDLKANEKLQRLTELKQAQEALERERTALLEARRRRSEFQTGRQEIVQHLTRGIGLIEKNEQSARRDAEQMAKTLADLNAVLEKVNDINAETWTSDNYDVELTRALTAIENARMEWNAAQIKWAFLTNSSAATNGELAGAQKPAVQRLLDQYDFRELSKLGLALTWPMVAAFLLGLLMWALFMRR